MARQSTIPVSFNKSTRKDTAVLMTSAKAGVVAPVAYIPLLPGDSASGRVGIDVQLKEMPKPLLNGVFANVQAWFVPKSAFPHFSGRDELMHAMTGEKIKTLTGERTPPDYFSVTTAGGANSVANSELGKVLGLHVAANETINTDLVDAFNLVYNFRLAAHSSRLPRRQYYAENGAASLTLPPAFWPSSRLSRVVPDYERALLVGSLDLDVAAGRLPVSGIGVDPANKTWASSTGSIESTGNAAKTYNRGLVVGENKNAAAVVIKKSNNGEMPEIFAEMAGQSMNITLADIDKARTTQAFAKLRTAYAGNDATGFDNDDTLVALLMQGLNVPDEQFKRPWLLDSQRVAVGFAERFATDAANLDASVTLGRASATLSLNVPQQDVGGMIIVTVEVLPERVDERMSDEYLYATKFDDLPNALRDVQRTEPVDLVLNRRIDAKHATPRGLYGYEPMNDKWNRDFTRLGGDFYMATPGGGWTENRSNIWQTEIVNPTFSATHYLAPKPFPQDVFADPTADAFECVCRHAVSIVGLTQIGDVLAENNDDYSQIISAGDNPGPNKVIG
ncbi:major capsid protein [Tortoise microvirus 38]|nr:major capsid protein [Tortoise microvirus 38]